MVGGEAWAVHLVLGLPGASRSDCALRLKDLALSGKAAEARGAAVAVGEPAAAWVRWTQWPGPGPL